MNYTCFDRDFVPMTDASQTHFVRMSEVAKENGTNVQHEHLYARVVVKQAGYRYVFLSNEEETPVDVYFDEVSGRSAG